MASTISNSSSNSLPIVCIFERHWDTTSKKVVRELIEDLSEQGYHSLCFEAAQDQSSNDIVLSHAQGLKEDEELYQTTLIYLKNVSPQDLLKYTGYQSLYGLLAKTNNLRDMDLGELTNLLMYFVSTQKYRIVANKIRDLEAKQSLQGIFAVSKNLNISVIGVDIDSEKYAEVRAAALDSNYSAIKEADDERIETIFKNLVAHRNEGIIFVCGALHAEKLMEKFKRSNMENDIVYYFPHSSARLYKSMDDIGLVTNNNNTLRDHHTELSANDVKPFAAQIVQKLPSNQYKIVPEGNSHTQILSKVFHTPFIAFLRPNYYVDACVPIGQETDTIEKRLADADIATRRVMIDGTEYLAVMAVNAREVADKIRTL